MPVPIFWKATSGRRGNTPHTACLLYTSLAASEQAAGEAEQNRLLRDRVTDEEIAEIVARWTGIPVTRLMEGERQKLCLLYTSVEWYLDDEPQQLVVPLD